MLNCPGNLLFGDVGPNPTPLLVRLGRIHSLLLLCLHFSWSKTGFLEVVVVVVVVVLFVVVVVVVVTVDVVVVLVVVVVVLEVVFVLEVLVVFLKVVAPQISKHKTDERAHGRTDRQNLL